MSKAEEHTNGGTPVEAAEKIAEQVEKLNGEC